MKFAITYMGGYVFQHFGQTRQFKVYDTDSGESSILDSGEYSHGSLATLLEMKGVQALLCGGIGDGARNMLKNRGIEVYPGQQGDVDEVAKAFMDGKIVQQHKCTCNHDHECHCHD